MASHMQNPAGEDGACEGFPLGRWDPEQDTATNPVRQDNLVGTITKNKREKIHVGLRTFNGDRLCDVRTYKNLNGVEIGTGQGLPFRPGDIDQLIELLHLVKAAAMAEGLLL
jgi:hypothetical protein